MLEIRNIDYAKDLKWCYETALECSYASKLPFVEVDQNLSMQVISDLARTKTFRVLWLDNARVGWFAIGMQQAAVYSRQEALALLSYQCNLKGRKAVNALLDVHEFMYDYAVRHKHRFLISNSVLNSRLSFNRILEKYDWVQHNGMLYREVEQPVSRHPAKNLPPHHANY